MLWSIASVDLSRLFSSSSHTIAHDAGDDCATHADRMILLIAMFAINGREIFLAAAQQNRAAIYGNNFKNRVEYFPHQFLRMAQLVDARSDSQDDPQVARHSFVRRICDQRLL